MTQTTTGSQPPPRSAPGASAETSLGDPTAPRTATGPRLGRAAGFWLVAVTSAALLAASSAPSPLYSVYQERFGFSALTLTVVFAAYVVALLGSLLTVGSLSDLVGRRPVLAGALVVEIAAMALFLAADGVGWLVAARVVQGLATGAAIGVLGAYLLDLQPPGGGRLGSLVNSIAPGVGLAVGAVVAGTFVQYGPDPSQLVFWVLGGVFVVLTAAVAVLPETVHRAPGALASLRPRVGVPTPARGPFWRAAPLMLATWALGGLVFSIGGSVLAARFGVANHATVGVVLALLPAAGSLAGFVLRDLAPRTMVRLGAVALVIGPVGYLVALVSASLWVFAVAAVVAGVGFGIGFLGSLRAVTQLVEPQERAALLSAVFVISYLGFSLPALVAGVLTTEIGLLHTAYGYAVFVGLLAAVALVAELAATRRRA